MYYLECAEILIFSRKEKFTKFLNCIKTNRARGIFKVASLSWRMVFVLSTNKDREPLVPWICRMFTKEEFKD